VDTNGPELLSAPEALRAIRKSLGLKQKHLHSDSLSAGYVAIIEQGKFIPSDSVFREILETLGITVAEFELIQRNPQLLQVLEILVVAEQHMLDGQQTAASALLVSCADDGRNLIRFRVLEAEIDVYNGDYVSAEISLMEVFAQMRAHSHFGLFDRAIIAYGRIGDSQSSLIKSIVLLSEFRNDYKERLTPMQQALMCAMLIARIGSLGDLDTAEQVLADFDKNNYELDPLSAGRLSWGKCNLRMDQGRFQEAREYAAEAKVLLEGNIDSNSFAIVTGLEFYINAFDPHFPDANRQSEIMRIDNEFERLQSEAMPYVLDGLKLSKALHYVNLQMFAEATTECKQIISTSVSSELILIARTAYARSLAALDEKAKATEQLQEILVALDLVELQAVIRPQVEKCARIARDLGEHELALSITLSLDSPKRLPLDGLV
jgi:transcriptional regulator with XRE-family HTH domain